MKKAVNKSFYVVYLDQFAVSGIFESNLSTWNRIRELLFEGVKKKIIICPRSVEHLLESSQKHRKGAIEMDEQFSELSEGYVFKAELFITSQLISSFIRKNTITLKTFLYTKVAKNTLSKSASFDSLLKNKVRFNSMISEGTKEINQIRKINREVRNKGVVIADLTEVVKFVNVAEFINRLRDLKAFGYIYIRGVQVGDTKVPHFVDQIIHQLLQKHRFSEEEMDLLILELNRNGFRNFPTLNIRFSLEGLIAAHNKKENVNDHIDIMRITSGFLISDFFLTDKQRKHEILELEFDRVYDTKVFSGAEEDLISLIYNLEEIINI